MDFPFLLDKPYFCGSKDIHVANFSSWLGNIRQVFKMALWFPALLVLTADNSFRFLSSRPQLLTCIERNSHDFIFFIYELDYDDINVFECSTFFSLDRC